MLKGAHATRNNTIRGAYRIVSYRNERYDTIRPAYDTIRYDAPENVDKYVSFVSFVLYRATRILSILERKKSGPP